MRASVVLIIAILSKSTSSALTIQNHLFCSFRLLHSWRFIHQVPRWWPSRKLLQEDGREVKIGLIVISENDNIDGLVKKLPDLSISIDLGGGYRHFRSDPRLVISIRILSIPPSPSGMPFRDSSRKKFFCVVLYGTVSVHNCCADTTCCGVRHHQ